MSLFKRANALVLFLVTLLIIVSITTGFLYIQSTNASNSRAALAKVLGQDLYVHKSSSGSLGASAPPEPPNYSCPTGEAGLYGDLDAYSFNLYMDNMGTGASYTNPNWNPSNYIYSFCYGVGQSGILDYSYGQNGIPWMECSLIFTNTNHAGWALLTDNHVGTFYMISDACQ